MKLIENWKECWKMTSFQLSLLVITLQWGQNLLVEMPQTPQEWTLSLSLLVLPLARVWKQTSLQNNKEA
ncbi:hypothetical protein [Salinivibrio phage CW02]|uniref:Uncharacterized protein n=1 Tax=Salinivibrio phage CW02 TaxID=1161935 RepID=H9D1I0_9CAUD|nr:holin [Salinivibrio phage CW02]AFE86222.1 hypothetical protein [Salinivibrio phage CW02]